MSFYNLKVSYVPCHNAVHVPRIRLVFLVSWLFPPLPWCLLELSQSYRDRICFRKMFCALLFLWYTESFLFSLFFLLFSSFFFFILVGERFGLLIYVGFFFVPPWGHLFLLSDFSLIQVPRHYGLNMKKQFCLNKTVIHCGKIWAFVKCLLISCVYSFVLFTGDFSRALKWQNCAMELKREKQKPEKPKQATTF